MSSRPARWARPASGSPYEQIMDRHSRQAAGASRAAPPADVPGASPGPVADPDLLAELILATGRGDARAFRRLYDGASPILLGLLMRKLGRRDLAEDALQDCFIKIWQKAATYDPARGAAIAWLATLARNQGIDALRKQVPEDGMDDLESFMAEHTGGDSDLEREADMALALRRLEAPLAALAPQVRASILLTCYAGHSHAEGARILRAPLGTIKSWVRRGLEQLRIQALPSAADSPL